MTVIDEFLTRVTPLQKVEFEKICKIVKDLVPDAMETITYGIPTFKYKEKYLIGFCAYKHHLSLFPTAKPILQFKDELKDFKVSPGTIQFSAGNPIPEPLINKIILYRLQGILEELITV